MGSGQIVRCRAKYDPDGNPGSVALTDVAPQAIVAFVRRIPKFEFDYALPVNIRSNCTLLELKRLTAAGFMPAIWF